MTTTTEIERRALTLRSLINTSVADRDRRVYEFNRAAERDSYRYAMRWHGESLMVAEATLALFSRLTVARDVELIELAHKVRDELAHNLLEGRYESASTNTIPRLEAAAERKAAVNVRRILTDVLAMRYEEETP